jgi:hypothetical protein
MALSSNFGKRALALIGEKILGILGNLRNFKKLKICLETILFLSCSWDSFFFFPFFEIGIKRVYFGL